MKIKFTRASNLQPFQYGKVKNLVTPYVLKNKEYKSCNIRLSTNGLANIETNLVGFTPKKPYKEWKGIGASPLQSQLLTLPMSQRIINYKAFCTMPNQKNNTQKQEEPSATKQGINQAIKIYRKFREIADQFSKKSRNYYLKFTELYLRGYGEMVFFYEPISDISFKYKFKKLKENANKKIDHIGTAYQKTYKDISDNLRNPIIGGKDVSDEISKEFMKEFAKNYSKPFAYRANVEEELNMEFERGKAIAYGRFSVQLPIMLFLVLLAALLTWLANMLLTNRKEDLYHFNLTRQEVEEYLKENEKLIEEISLTRYDSSKKENFADTHVKMEKTFFYKFERQLTEAESLLKKIEELDIERHHVFAGLDIDVKHKIKKLKINMEQAKLRLEVVGLINKSVIRCKIGDLKEAIEFIETAISKDEKNAYAIGYKGYILMKMGKLDEAETALKEAFVLKPVDQYILSNLGAVFAEQGKNEEATNYYQKAIDVNPYFAVPYCNYGDLLYKQGNLENAIAFYKKSLIVDPNYFVAMSKCSNALIELGRYGEALNMAEKAVNIQPNNFNSLLSLANASYHLGHLNDAKDVITKLSKIYPKDQSLIELTQKVRERELLLGDRPLLDAQKQGKPYRDCEDKNDGMILAYARYNIFRSIGSKTHTELNACPQIDCSQICEDKQLVASLVLPHSCCYS